MVWLTSGIWLVGEALLIKRKTRTMSKKWCQWVGDKGHKRNVHGVPVIHDLRGPLPLFFFFYWCHCNSEALTFCHEIGWSFWSWVAVTWAENILQRIWNKRFKKRKIENDLVRFQLFKVNSEEKFSVVRFWFCLSKFRF